jgi:hypothetical protein
MSASKLRRSIAWRRTESASPRPSRRARSPTLRIPAFLRDCCPVRTGSRILRCRCHPPIRRGRICFICRGTNTAAFIGAVILDSKTLAPGLDRGFDYYDNFPQHSQTKSRWGRLERRGMDVVERAETWLSAHPQGPHFVWVHLYDPHDPYEPPAPYSQIYKDRLYDGENRLR